jgi:hypothetical protein
MAGMDTLIKIAQAPAPFRKRAEYSMTEPL